MTAEMITTLLIATVLSLAAAAAALVRSARRERFVLERLAAMQERIREVGTRVDAAEQDVALAVTQAAMAEALLLDKGIADEEELEDFRRRFGREEEVAGGGYEPGRDGELN